jgi:signal transduction histidine kinase
MEMDNRGNEDKWEEAFIAYGLDASVGRLFRGIIHNLNGVGQAFSMQAELLQMMFSQADKIIEGISRAEDSTEIEESCKKLKELLGRRASMIDRLPGEVDVLQLTMQRASSLMEDVRDPSGVHAFKLESAILAEIEFLKTDGFFKHKVTRNLSFADDIPAIKRHRVEIHQIISALLENASLALQEDIDSFHPPTIKILTGLTGEYIEVKIIDNGGGIAPEDLGKIFEPFYTTRKNRLGLGLSLARIMAERFQGKITCSSTVGQTCFVLNIPLMVTAVE